MKRIGLLSLALVLALGTLGVAYAPWTDEVEIIQTVETGSLEIGVRGEAVKVGDTKNVMGLDVTHGEWKFEKNGDDFFESVTVAISNMYPSVWVNETFEIAIGGSVPVHLYPEIDIEDTDGVFECMDIIWRILDDAGELVAEGEGLDALGEALPDHQAYPCEIITIEIDKHLEQCAPQDATASFTISIVAYQYNYTPTPAP